MRKALLLLILPIVFSCKGQNSASQKAMETKNVPSLAQVLETDSFKIEKVSSGTWNEIRYDPVRDFYIIAQNKKVAKLNGKGEVIFEMSLEEQDLGGMGDLRDVHHPTAFVISWHGIYDLAEQKPQLHAFKSVFNKDEKMEWKEWDLKFGDLYNNADAVLWGFRKSAGSRTFPLYFRRNGTWQILYTMPESTTSIITRGHYVTLRVNGEYIPDKIDTLYLLKEARTGTYSNYNTFDGPYNLSDWPEASLQYADRAHLETLSFKKEDSRPEPYSPRPVEFGGTAVNKLTVGTETFTFKSKATLLAQARKEEVETYFYLFEVPLKFRKPGTPLFLYYQYPTNWNSDENAGVYAVKQKAK